MMSESEPYTSKNMFTVGDSSLASSFTGACWVLQAFSESEGVCVCSSNGDWEGQAVALWLCSYQKLHGKNIDMSFETAFKACKI